MPDKHDNTPSAEARDLHPSGPDNSELGGRWQLPSSHAIDQTVEVTPVIEPAEPEQLDLFTETEQLAEDGDSAETTVAKSTMDSFIELQRKRYGPDSEYAKRIKGE